MYIWICFHFFLSLKKLFLNFENYGFPRASELTFALFLASTLVLGCSDYIYPTMHNALFRYLLSVHANKNEVQLALFSAADRVAKDKDWLSCNREFNELT
jgi:hypothetical protein